MSTLLKNFPANLVQTLRANHRASLLWLAVAVLVLAPITFTLLPITALWTRLIALYILAWWVPGALLITRWRLTDLDLPTAGIYALAAGLCWMIMIVLILYWIPGAIAGWQLVGAYAIGLLALILLLYVPTQTLDPQKNAQYRSTQSNKSGATNLKTWGWLALLLIFATLMRFPGLGYHELHVDEVYVLYRAQQAIAGGTEKEPDPLAIHTKGPGEIAMAMPVYRALGTADEATGRFAFALASVGSVIALALLGWRIFSFPVGMWAGTLLAVNGFALGLSRIVQYQGVILLLTVATALAAWEFSQRGDRNRLLLVAILSAFGVIMHYEFALMTPLLLVLVWQGWQQNKKTQQPTIWPAVFAGGAVGTILLAATYVPFLLNPHFEATQSYLSNRLGTSLNFNLPFFIEMGTFYNSIYYLVGLILLMLTGLLFGQFSTVDSTVDNTALDNTAVDSTAAKSQYLTQRLLLLLWFAPYFILYIFIMIYPGTHFYQFMLSWSLLAALPLSYFTQTKNFSKAVRVGIVALVIGWLTLSANYLRLMFFQQQPEYVTNYQKIRNPLYWAPYGEQIPQKPRFGFPIARGWKALGALASWGYLGDTYAANDRSGYLSRWYLTEIERVPLVDQPRFVFITRPPQQADRDFDDDRMEGVYQRAGEVQVSGEPRIEIWSRDPLPVSYVTFDAAYFEEIFAQQVARLDDLQQPNDQSTTRLPDQSTTRPPVQLTEWLTLQASTVADNRLEPGQALYLYLEWLPKTQPSVAYKLFVHVADEAGRPLAQWDGHPGMNLVRTTQWTANTPFADHVLVPIPAEMPAGSYQVLVGLYDPATGERVGGQSIKVGGITIRN